MRGIFMPFTNFSNLFRDPSSVPDVYRKHPVVRKLFQDNGAYVRPAEDPVTLWAIDLLTREYGVPLDAMQLELFADFAEGTHQEGRRYLGRVDVVVYDDRYADAIGNLDVAFIMVEAMEPEKRFGGNEPEGWNQHLERLNAYMSAETSPRMVYKSWQ
jgi:type I restriction enzyme M protein